jgi:hypothetical protein
MVWRVRRVVTRHDKDGKVNPFGSGGQNASIIMGRD